MKFHNGYLPLLLALVLGNCTNLDLLEKLEKPAGTLKSHYIFVSSIKTDGILTQLTNGGCTNASGALAQADCSCRDMAKAAGLPGSDMYMAWMSTTTPTPIWALCRMQGINSNACGINGIASWYNRKNELIANSLGELTSPSGIKAAIRYTEYGTPTDVGEVFTGTNASGSNAPNTCGDWSNAGSSGNYGDPNAATIDWSQTIDNSFSCGNQRPIYCIRKP